MQQLQSSTRREFISGAVTAAGGPLLAGCAGAGTSSGRSQELHRSEAESEKGISPAEDLMREHGVLRRILLVYGEAIDRLDGAGQLPAGALPDAAKIIRTFIEQYHEKLEEDSLFPRFRKAGVLADLVDVLLQQHAAGRKLTDEVLRLSAPAAMKTADDRKALSHALRQFVRMYSPHAAREDTVLFPAFRQIVTAKEYEELGEAFEGKEHDLFGDKGFEKMVDRVAAIEKALGIYDLAHFTAKA